MTKISTFVPDTEINGKDKLIGTDFNNAQKTKNFKVEDLGTHFNLVNGSRNFEYLFYNHLSISQAPVDGAFYANGNEQDPNNITHFFISKKTSNNKDVSSFFDSITAENPFDLIISQSTDLNTIFFFNISSVESISGYYKLTVSEVFFPQGKTMEFMASNVVFNLKATNHIHNNLSGLNDGDYQHLTALEKTKFDNLPNTFITNHSQLSLNDGTNPHGTTKTDVGLSNVNNTSDADKPVSTAQQTALNLKQDNLTETNFGTFSNSLTTEDTIPDAGIFNYTNVLGIQVKTTWANIKAKLASIFLTKVSTVDVEKVYIKNADGTQGMKPVSDLITLDRLVYFFQGGSSMPTINTWYGNNLGFAINGTTTFGNGASPAFPFTTIGAMVIPSGYIVEKIIFGEYSNPTNVSHDLEIYIARGEFTDNQLANQLTNYDVIANETISIGYVTATPKFFKNLTISNHSAKERSAIQIAMRQKTNNSQSAYSMTIILKKT